MIRSRMPLRPSRRVVVPLVAVAGAALAAYTLRNLDFAALAGAFGGVDPVWVAVAAALECCSLACAGTAWRIGMGAGGLGSVPLRHVLAAHWIGQAANSVLPARLGEAARVMTLRRHVRDRPTPVAQIAGSLVAQRALAGIAAFTVVVLVAVAIPLPGPLHDLRWAAFGALVAGVVTALVARRLGLGRRAARRVPARLRSVTDGMVAGAGVLGSARARNWSFALHVIELATQLGSIMALFLAFGLGTPLSAALMVFCLTATAGLIPALPGGLGLGQLALVVPLGAAYGVAAPLALAFSLGRQGIVMAVAVAGGLVALLHQRLSRRRATLAP
jgi:uncharacterized membrane protein YbhN (UPF0104 family)